MVNAGEYKLNGNLSYTGKAFTIAAAEGADVSFDMSAAVALHGAKITFNNVTFDYKTNGNYIGLQHTDTLVYNNCTINGVVFLYAVNETFNGCTFKQESPDAYNVWTYGAQNVAFNGCTFNCVGKAVLVYNEGAIAKTDLTVKDTKFIASAPVEDKAAIEIDTSLMEGGATITVDDKTTAAGFDNGSNSGNPLWNDKKQTADTNKNTTVTVAGEKVFEPKATVVKPVSVNGTSYETLEDAIDAATPDANGVVTYEISGKVDVTATGWVQVAKSGLTGLTAVKFVGTTDDAKICINGGLAILADQNYDIDVSFEALALSKLNPTYGGDYGHSTNYFTTWLRNSGAAENTVTYTNCTFPNGVSNNQYGKTVFDNCKFTNGATGLYNLWNYGGSTEIKNSSFTGTRGIKAYSEGVDGGQIEVADTTFNGLGEKAAIVVSKATTVMLNKVDATECTKGLLQKDIDGGSLKTTIEANGTGISGKFDITATTTADAAKNEFNISAGTFTSEVSNDYCADGFEVKANDNGTYGVVEAATADGDGTEANPYTLEQLGAMTRQAYIEAQNRLNGTMYVTVGDYTYGTNGVLGNGVRDDTTGQIPDHSKLNAYGENGYLGEKNDGANGKSVVFVGGSITSSVTGYTSIDKIGTSLLLALPAYTNVTFKGITFNNVMSFNYQLYTSPWSQLGELKFDGCTFNGIIVGAIAAQTLTFNKCVFENYTNTTDANSSNPTWIRPAYGNWTQGDNEGQGSDFKSLTTINFTDNKVTSTRPVKFEYISQWDITSTVTATGNSFDISKQDGDTAIKNVGLYLGAHTDANAFNLVAENNTKSKNTAALYTIPEGKTSLPLGSTVKNLAGEPVELTDALKWKAGDATADKIVLETVEAVASVGSKQYGSLQAAIDAASRNATVTMLADTKENVTISKALTLDLNGFTLNGGTEKGKPALTITARIVTIEDSSEAQTGTIMREDTAENSGVSSHYVIDIQGNGWVNFKSGTVKNGSGAGGTKGASLVRVGDDRVKKYPGLVINGGTFTQDNFIVIKVDRGHLTLNGGTLNSANTYAVENWFNATIKGGTVNGAVSSWTYSAGSNSTLTISGGTVNGDVTSVNYGDADKVAKVEITDGTVNGQLDTRSYDPNTGELTSIDDAAKATIKVSGGTFSSAVPAEYCAAGFIPTANADGTYGVQQQQVLAKIGDTAYYTMDAAFHAVQAGETIVMQRDYTTGAEQYSGNKSFAIDLNGKTWTYTGTNTNHAAFEINHPNVTLTVQNGTVASNSMVGLIPSAMGVGGTITYDNAGLVFEGVTMTAKGHSGIETNGNNTNDAVTLKNSTLNVPDGFGIYFPSSGTLTIDNSTINAKTMGVQVCAGSLSINAGSAITVTGDAVPKTENDGAIQDGAAISIVNRTGYKGLGDVTVTGGKFTAKAGNKAIKAYDWANNTETEFTAAEKVAVSGGTFSSAVPEGLCATGYIPVANGDGTYGVELGNYVVVGGIKGFENTKFASFADAYDAIKPVLEKICANDPLGEGTPANADAFDAVFTDVKDGRATLTYTITGNVTYDETGYANLLTMGRRSSHYLTNERHLINFKFVGAEAERGATLTVNSNITLPYEWWGEKITTAISFENLTITGSASNGLYTYQPYFEGIDFKVNNCTLKGIKIYNCANVGGSYTITNSTLDGTGAPAGAYAIHLQGNETAPLNITISGNQISGYDRGINIDQNTAVATISGNTIGINDVNRSCIQLTRLASTEVKDNTLNLNGGNAFTLHKNLAAGSKIDIAGNTIDGNGYLIYDDTKNAIDLTYTNNTITGNVDTTKGVYDGATKALTDGVDVVINGVKAAQIGDVKYETLAEAIAAAKDGETVTLLADATEDVTINKNITLDLGGKTLTNTNSGKATVTIAKGATTTVQNGSISGGTSYYNIQNNGIATFTGVTATAGNTGSSMIDNWGTLTIESGDYEGGLNVVKSEEGSTLTINGGKFTRDWAPKYGVTGTILVYGTTTIKDGTFIDKSTSNNARVVVTGVVEGYTSITYVKGGSFTRTGSGNIFHGLGKATSDNFEVSGGTFNKSISDGYCADGFIPTKNADGTYGVKEGKYVAQVGKYNKYESLAEAISHSSRSTIKLLANVTENVTIPAGKTITLDLNGFTLNGGTGTANAALYNLGTITIRDSSAAQTGTIKRDDAGIEGETSYYVIRNQGTMTIESGNVINNSGYRKVNSTGSMVGSSLICNGDCDEGGTLTIKGGTFTQNNFIAIKNGVLGVLKVTGGTITSNHSAIQNWFEADITGGKITGQLWTDAWEEGKSVGKTTIGGDATFAGEIVMDITGSVAPTLAINGGNLNVTRWRITNAAANAGAKPAVSGGTFSSAVKEEYCATGYIPKDNGDGTYGVKEGVYVAKVDNVKYETLQAAIDAAKGNSTVRLLANVTLTETAVFPAGKTVHLNLVGHNITATGTALRINGKTDIQSTDGVGTIESTGNVAVAVGDNASLTVYSGTLKGREGAVITGTSTGAKIEIRKNATLIATDNAVIAGNGSKRDGNPNTILVKGGTFIGGIETTGYIACGIYAPWNDNVTVSGGTFNITNGAGIVARAGTVKVTGGTFNCGDGTAEGWVGDSKNKVPCAALVFDKAANYPALTADSKILVSGGSFSTDPAANGATLADGYVATQTDGMYKVAKADPTAEINGVKYDTLQAAINAAQATKDGATITLLTDINTSSYYEVKGENPVTIDLAGHNITGSGISGLFYVTAKGDLTIKGEGTVTAVEDNGAAMAVWVRSPIAKVTLEGGTYTQQITNTADHHFDLIYVERGNVYVKGGTYKGATPDWTLNCYDEHYQSKEANIEVTGGTFVGFDPANNKAEGENTNFVPAGYVSTKGADGNYTVEEYKPVEVWTGYSGAKVASYATVAEAAEKLDGNKWIVIGKDYTLTEDFTIGGENLDNLYLDVAEGATLTVAEGVTLTVAANAKRLGVRDGATLVNKGTIVVCGSSTSNGFAMLYGTFTGNELTVPEGCFLDNNGKNFFATANENAVYEITFGDGTVKKTADSTNIKGGNVKQIKLLKDVTNGGWTLDSSSVGAEVVLDLNGHTISYNGANRYYATLNVYTKVTIKNGTVKYEGSKRGAIDLVGQGDLTIERDVTIDGGDGFAIFTSGTSKLTVNGKVTANGNYAIAGNGSKDAGGYIDSCDIIVNGGAVISASKGIAIYHPEKGTVTINGGTITGHTGIEMCAGQLVVNGGSITSNGDNMDATGSQNAILDGAAISIINRNYPGGVPTAVIKGGTFAANGKDAQTVKAYDYTGDKVAEWTAAGDNVNISGGTFSSIPTNMGVLCADGYKTVYDAYADMYNVVKQDAKITVGKRLSIGNDLTITYLVSLTDCTNPWVKFQFYNDDIKGYTTVEVKNYGTDTVTGPDGKPMDVFTFDFTGINPQRMTDTLKATVYAKDANGNVVEYQVDDYSVAQYCSNKLAKLGQNDPLRKLIGNLVAYGAAAQVYQNYRTDNLVSTVVSGAVSTDYTDRLSSVTQYTEKVLGTAGVNIKGKTLVLSNTFAVRVYFTVNEGVDIANVSFNVTANGKTDTVNSFEKDEKLGYYYFDYANLNATQLDSEVKFESFVNETGVGDMVTYSVNTYLAKKMPNYDKSSNAYKLMAELFNYGCACTEYASK